MTEQRTGSCQERTGSAFSMGLAKLQAGPLDGTRELEPEVYRFARSKQAWVTLPSQARPFDTPPEDPMDMLAAAQAYRESSQK